MDEGRDTPTDAMAQWVVYVRQSGRLRHVMMTRIHDVGKVYHFRAKHRMAQSLGQVAKLKRQHEQQQPQPEAEENSIPGNGDKQ